MELLYGCPLLEDLKADGLQYAHDGTFCKDRFKNFYFPKLVRAKINSIGMEMDSSIILLKAISNVEFLTISIKFGGDDYAVPEFPHLTHLTLTLRQKHLVLLMLKNFPKLFKV
ncbi:uncharacterized protein LOC130732115 [Lotus japonicus]|uniref:uncharacterized protein LOC130732115 n=1 Tax=Lotus japonicus TaxID=34305 RepID=UPI002583DE86|nr:uncharacterized protein LOC130732115 [Lotus japonicus]